MFIIDENMEELALSLRRNEKGITIQKNWPFYISLNTFDHKTQLFCFYVFIQEKNVQRDNYSRLQITVLFLIDKKLELG